MCSIDTMFYARKLMSEDTIYCTVAQAYIKKHIHSYIIFLHYYYRNYFCTMRFCLTRKSKLIHSNILPYWIALQRLHNIQRLFLLYTLLWDYKYNKNIFAAWCVWPLRTLFSILDMILKITCTYLPGCLAACIDGLG